MSCSFAFYVSCNSILSWNSEISNAGFRTNVFCPCNRLSASGNVYAKFSGIEMSRNHSTIYLFTDADSKDDARGTEALNAASAKNITVNFLLTGTCTSSGRRKRSIAQGKPLHQINQKFSFVDFNIDVLILDMFYVQ